MKSESYLRYLLSDNISLRKYFRERNIVSLKDVKRSLLIRVRNLGYFVPDHYYRLGSEVSFIDIKELSELFTIGLPRLVDEYLEIHDGKVYVKGNMMNDWQLLLPLIPPLLLTMIKIWKEYGADMESIVDFAYQRLLPTVKYTAIPSAYLPEMTVLKEENHGFDDLHIHLNGAVETDLAWHDFLRYPEVVYKDIYRAYNNDKVKEQFEQLTDISDPIEFLQLFSIAGRIREWLFAKVMYGKGIYEINSFEELLFKLAEKTENHCEHPFKPLMDESTSPLILESLLYVKTLGYMAVHPQDYIVAGVFHYYLLILGMCNKLLVQQVDTFGFEQFQKYTSNNFRQYSEKTYPQRFLQLSGNDMGNIRHIEGRFSPKNTLKGNLDIINKITYGFNRLKHTQEKTGMALTSMSLVAHYIKKYDSDDIDKWKVRFESLRKDAERTTDALIALMNTHSKFSSMLTGVDAAASEFDTPPEVYATSFRRLRKYGMRHFTYHAGEDFFHILSGLRAIYEAIEYLDLQTGDRIGHATAAGVDVKLWKEHIGERLWMRIEDYLDDLVFAYHLIATSEGSNMKSILPQIALRIEEYAAKIYPTTYTVNELIDAWLKRKDDPLIFSKEKPNMIASV